MKKKIPVDVSEKIQALSSEFVLMDINSEAELSAIIKIVLDIKEDAGKQEIDCVDRLIDLLLNYLGRIQEENIFEAVSYIISELQAVCEKSVDALDMDAVVAHVKKVSSKKDEKTEQLSDSQKKMICEFIANAKNVVADIEAQMLVFEKNPDDNESMNAVFGLFHTLKGESGILGIDNICAIAHEAENVFEQLRNKKLRLESETVSILLESVDGLKGIIKVVEKNIDKGLAIDVSEIKSKLSEIILEKETVPESSTSESSVSESSVSELPSDISCEVVAEPSFSPTVPEIDFSDGTELLSDFISEGQDHLIAAEDCILVLEKSPHDMDEINRLFRVFHTIKGLASFFNLLDMQVLAHDTETMMDLARTGKLTINTRIIEAVLSSIDSIRKLFELLKEQLLNNGVLNSPYFDISDTLSNVRDIVRENRGCENPEPSKKLGEVLVEEEVISQNDLKEALAIQQTTQQDKKIGEILVESDKVDAEKINEALKVQQRGVVIEETIKISINKLDDLINNMGELVIVGNQVTQNKIIVDSEDPRLLKDIPQLTRIIRSIQDSVMSMRLVPVKPLFQKMLRLARDVSRKAKKEVEVIFSGDNTEIDKNMIELLGDPLVHMLRNSIDHGIEQADLRAQRGKPARGLINLNAYQKNGDIIIEIADDGQGLNKEKIKEKAIKNGLIEAGKSYDDSYIYNLIFEPGFSTAAQVTDISGRGVGMDVVRRNIERLRGKIEIDSTPEKGTTFRIKLPVTLSIIDGIVVSIRGDKYILPIFSVVEFIQQKKELITNVIGKGEMIKIQDEMFPVIRMDKFLSLGEQDVESDHFIGCLVHSDYGDVCLFVDEVIGQQQVVIKELGDRFERVKGVSGGAILGDGKVGLILDINAIVKSLKN